MVSRYPPREGPLTLQIQPIHIHFASKPQLPTGVLGGPKEFIKQILLSRPHWLLGWQGHGDGAHRVTVTLLTTTVLPTLGPLAEKEALSTFGQLFGARGSFYRKRETESKPLGSKYVL